MRQLGGSFGVALITTFISSQTTVHRSGLVTHLNINDPAVQQRIAAIQHGFMAKGKTAQEALKAAYQALDLNVTKQATVLSYMDIFIYLSIMFAICIPFVLMVKGNKKKKKLDLGEAMH